MRVADLRQGRRGKHHELVMPIIDEIAELADGEALVISPGAFKIPLSHLRSALTKAAVSRDLKIATYSEDGSLYVWRKTAGTSQYERAAKSPLKRKTAAK